MTSLSNEQEHLISGGLSAYDVGHNVGAAGRWCFDQFVAAGNLYTPML